MWAGMDPALPVVVDVSAADVARSAHSLADLHRYGGDLSHGALSAERIVLADARCLANSRCRSSWLRSARGGGQAPQKADERGFRAIPRPRHAHRHDDGRFHRATVRPGA
jgi:hypothetical protein